MAESKRAPAGKSNAASRSHHPTKNQCAWIKKGTKALGTLQLGGKILASALVPPSTKFELRSQDLK